MSPPISKEWWVAAALTGASVPVALGQTPAPAERTIGVVTTAKPGAPGQPGTVTYMPLISGAKEQRISTDGTGPVHVQFSDQSAITVAPNSTLVIKLYEHDESKKTGNTIIELAKGLMRYVGGQISKRSRAEIRTPTATIGIRGGISTVGLAPSGQTNATFLFGSFMSVQGPNGQPLFTITRPGFGFNGPSGPIRIPSSQLSQQLASIGFGVSPGVPPSGPPGGPAGGPFAGRFNVAGPLGNSIGTEQLRSVVVNTTQSNSTQTLRNLLGTQAQNVS